MKYPLNFDEIDAIEKYLPDFQNIEFNLVDIEIQAYQFLHWKKANLLLKDVNEIKDRKWVRISYTEAAWLKLIHLAKSFEISNNAILELKNVLQMNVIDEINVDYLDDTTISEINSLCKEHKIEVSPVDLLRMLKSNQFMNKKPFNTLFNFLLIRQIINKENLIFYIFKRNEKWNVLFLNDENLGVDKYSVESRKLIEEVKKGTHFAIALKDCVDDLGVSFFKSSEKSILKNDALSPDEKKLIHEIRTGNYKEIIIRKSKTDEDIRIEIKEDGMIEHNNIREIGSMLGNKGYKKISLTRRNEKQSYFEIIR
jgi:hypothetical protein